MTTPERICTCGNWGGHDGDCEVFAHNAPAAREVMTLSLAKAAVDLATVSPISYDQALRVIADAGGLLAAEAERDGLRAELAAERAENARLRSSLAFFAARFLAVAPRHSESEAGR